MEEGREWGRGGVLCMEDLPVVELNRFAVSHEQRTAYDRLAQAVRKIQ